MKTRSSSRKGGFTLLETVIAIGVLAVLLTGFMYVFGPAAAGIKKAINVQQADRLVSTLEQELVTFRKGNEAGLPAKTPPATNYTGFEKAFEWIKKSNDVQHALLIYQYRGDLAGIRDDGTPTPMSETKGKLPGQDYTLQTMVRTNKDISRLKEDLAAVEGVVYYVICTQLIFKNGELVLGTKGQIEDPKTGTVSDSADKYPEAVIAFNADFHALNNRSVSTFDAALTRQFTNAKDGKIKPIFSRNLAVRR